MQSHLTRLSGVSFILVDADGKHTRVGGSAMGGATFLGLSCLLAPVDNFDQGVMPCMMRCDEILM